MTDGPPAVAATGSSRGSPPVGPPLVLLAALGALLALGVAPDGRGAGTARQPPVAISIEPSCPPPGMLACNPALRLTVTVGERPPAVVRGLFRSALLTGLRLAGYRRLQYRPAGGDRFAGRVSSQREAVARWRAAGGMLEVATGGLRLRRMPP